MSLIFRKASSSSIQFFWYENNRNKLKQIDSEPESEANTTHAGSCYIDKKKNWDFHNQVVYKLLLIPIPTLPSLLRIPQQYSESTRRSFRSPFSVAMPWKAMASKVLCFSGATARVPLRLLPWDWPPHSSTRLKPCRDAGCYTSTFNHRFPLKPATLLFLFLFLWLSAVVCLFVCLLYV